MKKFFLTFMLFATLSIPALTLQSCDSENDDAPKANNTQRANDVESPIIGTASYINELYRIKQLSQSDSRNSELSEPLEESINDFVALSQDYLELNDIDLSEYFDNDDPRIALVALAIADIDRTLNTTPTSRTTIGGCVLEGLGIKALIEGPGKKAAAKIIAKALLKRAVPVVGWGLFAYDFIDCMTE